LGACGRLLESFVRLDQHASLEARLSALEAALAARDAGQWSQTVSRPTPTFSAESLP
jgi:hypothetical protein